MRKFIFTMLLTVMTAMLCNAQPFRPFNRMNFGMFNVKDTLALEKAPTPFPTKDGDYLISLPKGQKLVVAYNNDRTKAIIYRGFMTRHRFGHLWRTVYNVKDDEVRTILWYKDEHIYCGYIYDKKAKACQYFEAINEEEKEKIVSRLPMLRMMPTFTN